MGATSHSKLDRAVIARYYAFLIISQLIIFTLIGVIFSKCWYFWRLHPMSNYGEDSVKEIVQQIGRKASLSEIISNLHSELSVACSLSNFQCTPAALPAMINSTYINQSSYWLTFFP